MKKYIEPIIHTLLWLTGYILILGWAKHVGNFNREEGPFFYPITFGLLTNILLFYVPALRLIPELSVKKNTKIFLLKISLLFVGLGLMEAIIDHLFLINFYSSEKEPFVSKLFINTLDNLIILSLALGYGFTKNWIKIQHVQKKLKAEKLSAELNFLKAQVNPHFLFNVLNMAFSSATQNGDEQTADIIEKLAGLLRYMLYESNEDKVTIAKEVAYIESFMELQKMRLSANIPLTVNYEVTGNYQRSKIAPLILIPFIENAFKHGVKLNEKSEIDISLKINESNLDLKVKNGINRKQNEMQKKNSGIGLQNVKKRLELIYPNAHQLSILNTKDEFSVELHLQL
jgi:sensor histidine kinase YesM